MSKTNEEYWAERENAQDKKNRKAEEKYYQEIEKIYRQQLAEIEKEVSAFYSKYATEEGLTVAEVKKMCSQLDMDEYEKKAKEYVETKDFSDTANREMKIYNLTMKTSRLELLKANLNLVLKDRGSEAERKMAEQLFQEAQKEYKRQAGFMGDYLPNTRRSAKVTVEASFHSAKWSDRIWAHQKALKNDLNKILASGLTQGKGVRDFLDAIQKRHNVTEAQALRLLRTEFTRVRAQAQIDSMKAAEIDQFVVITAQIDTGPHRVCDHCKKKFNEHYKVEDGVIGENIPPFHPNCRCSIAPYVDDKDYEDWINSDTDQTYDEFINDENTFDPDDIFLNNDFKDRDDVTNKILELSGELKKLRKEISDMSGCTLAEIVDSNFSSDYAEIFEDWFDDGIRGFKKKYLELTTNIKSLSEYARGLPLTEATERRVRLLKGTPESPIAKAMTVAEYRQFRKFVADCEFEELADIWNASEGLFDFTEENTGAYYSVHEGRRKYSGSVVGKSTVLTNGDSCHKPMNVWYHEVGHGLDCCYAPYFKYYSGLNSRETKYRNYYTSARNLKFKDTIKREATELTDKWWKELNDALDKGKNLKQVSLDFNLNEDYIDYLQGLTKSERREYERNDLISRRIVTMTRDRYDKGMSTNDCYKICGDLMDMIEGGTNGKLKLDFGHGTSYWKKRYGSGVCSESFAEMTSSYMNNPESLELIKEFFPESHELYREMVRDIHGKVFKR